MTIDKDKTRIPNKRRLQIVSVVLIALSALPCMLTLINIPPVIQFAIQTGGDAALQIYIPLVLAALINGLGLVMLIVSLALKEKTTTLPKFTNYR
ncbi:MAG: hypothetical protein EHM40_04435 [Chloroflexi bacterium]|nr:MAG: hypothetical protein EHM40_04435 [Chloroflexota bacterium]